MHVKFLILAGLSLLTSAAHLSASNVSLGTIEQPINLVAHSDPSSIPLGSVIHEANYGYGIHRLITAPRPCRHGSMEWSGGTELNQNLANVFGILVEPTDGTNVPFAPVNIRIKAWEKPAYSPYSKEQVLQATLHCLLRSTGATPKHPLQIKIIAEDKADLAWAKPYEKNYINRPNPMGEAITPTKIAGTNLTTDNRGVTYVRFDGVKPLPDDKKQQPVMIASRMFGADGAGSTSAIIPVWTGTTFKDPLAAMGLPCGLYYNVFSPHTSIFPDANVLATQDRYLNWHSSVTAKETSISLLLGEVDEHNLAAAIYAAVIAVQPTPEKPLTITLGLTGGSFASFTANPDWKKVKTRSQPAIECRFVVDAKTGKITQGSLPNLEKVKRSSDRGIYVRNTTPHQK